VPDPQLHSHVLIHGALRSDGKVVAVESRAWLVHQREIGATYRSELAQELRELGFEIAHATGRGARYFELVGVPEGLRERWSSRHHQVAGAIEQRLAEKKAALEAVIEQGGPEAADAAVRLDGLERSGGSRSPVAPRRGHSRRRVIWIARGGRPRSSTTSTLGLSRSSAIVDVTGSRSGAISTTRSSRG
jgi:hypothetical protein